MQMTAAQVEMLMKWTKILFIYWTKYKTTDEFDPTVLKHLQGLRWYSLSFSEYHPHLIRLKSMEQSISALTVIDEESLRGGGYS